MTAQIAERDAFDGECFDSFVDLLREFLAGLSDETVIELWCQTESGLFSGLSNQVLLIQGDSSLLKNVSL